MYLSQKSAYIKLGQNLQKLRHERGLTQQCLSKKCEKVDRAKISDIENAKEDFMFSTLLNLCKGLEVSLYEVIKDVT